MRTMDGKQFFYPATLFPGFASEAEKHNDIAAVSLGEDLIVYVGHRKATPDGNDANEKFEFPHVHIDVFDGDYNYLGCVGQFIEAADAMAALPSMIPVIRDLYPNHVKCDEEEAA